MLIALCVLPHIVYAAQIKEVKRDGEINAFIAQDEINRISVVDDKIKRVMALGGELEVIEDKDQGDVYILNAADKSSPKSIFIITEKGMTYKATLVPKKMPAEQIFIKNIDQNTNTHDQHSANLQDRIVSVVKSLRAGASEAEAKEVEELKEYGGLFFMQSQEIEASGLIGKKLVFENTSSETVHLNYEQFSSRGLIAVSIDELEVLPAEHTFVYLIEGGKDGAS